MPLDVSPSGGCPEASAPRLKPFPAGNGDGGVPVLSGLPLPSGLLDRRVQKPGSPLADLTLAERDVLRLMAEGKSNRAIATTLGIAVGTVEKRSNVLFDKLGLTTEIDLNRRVAAVLLYLRETRPGGRSSTTAPASGT